VGHETINSQPLSEHLKSVVCLDSLPRCSNHDATLVEERAFTDHSSKR